MAGERHPFDKFMEELMTGEHTFTMPVEYGQSTGTPLKEAIKDLEDFHRMMLHKQAERTEETIERARKELLTSCKEIAIVVSEFRLYCQNQGLPRRLVHEMCMCLTDKLMGRK